MNNNVITHWWAVGFIINIVSVMFGLVVVSTFMFMFMLRKHFGLKQESLQTFVVAEFQQISPPSDRPSKFLSKGEIITYSQTFDKFGGPVKPSVEY